MGGYRTYEIVFLGSMLVAIVATAIVIRIARTLRLVDHPGVRKIHASAVPRIGGAAIVLAMLALTLPILLLDNRVGEAFRQSRFHILAILAGGLVMFAMGLLDDTRGLRARVKLLVQLGAALAVCALGVRITSMTLGSWFSVQFDWLSWPITVLWIVGVTNAVNLIDGLDGLAAGICMITCAVLAAFALAAGQFVMVILMLAMLGALIGFLFLNFNPARIFMGDCGSLFLGFVLSAASVQCAEKSAMIVGIALPFVALGVPILDMLLSIVRRVLQRRGIFSPDRGHIHHRLLAKGLGHRQVALLIYAVTLIAAGLGLFMIFIRGAGVVAILALVLLLLTVVFRAAGAMRLREAWAAMQHSVAILRQADEEKREVDEAAIVLADAKGFQEWWAAVCRAAERLEFLMVSMNVTNRDGSGRTLLWRRPGDDLAPRRKIDVSVPIRDRRSNSPLQAQIEVSLNGSLESAGRKIAFFGRLLDEHGVARLPAGPPQGAPALAAPPAHRNAAEPAEAPVSSTPAAPAAKAKELP